MISVCVAAYNGNRYIEEQLRSVLAQLSAEDEVVVSDDGSTDGTPEIIASIGDGRIRLIANNGAHGVNGNFDNALRHARGEYIFLADQDDVWLEGKVINCMNALKNADLVVHDAIIVDSSLKTQNKTLFSELKIKEGFVANYIRNRFTGCCMAFRREVLEYVLPIPTGVKFYHDSWIGLLVSLRGRVRFMETAGILFRRHDSTKSSAGGSSGFGLGSKIAYRASLGYNIVKRMMK